MKYVIANGAGTQSRDYLMANQISRLPDTAFVSPVEVAALSGFKKSSIQSRAQRARLGMPQPLNIRHLTWRLGDIRKWQSGAALEDPRIPSPNKTGRPTKAAQIAKEREKQVKKATHA
jgi:predicted DNA-binding transcriptional regulator AlpA